jgi:hypothetical protein
MGARIEAKKSEQLGTVARLEIQNAAKRRTETEQFLMQQEQLLGTPDQIMGRLGGGVSNSELPYIQRYQFNDSQASSLTGQQYKIDSLKSGVTKANSLLEQAQAAARAGDMAGAQQLKLQADNAVLGDFASATRGKIFKDPTIYGSLITQTQDPNVAAATRLNSPIAQTVGANVAKGREFADPNSAASRQLFNSVVTAPVAEVSAGQRAALGNISSRTSSSLRDLDAGLGRALAEFTGGEVKALSAIDSGFGRALQAITVGESKSVGEIESGLQYALTAVQKATENALRAIESGAEGTRRAAVDQMRQRGSAARPFETQAVQARTEERFSTQRAITETEKGRQEAALQAGASGEKAGIYERSNMARAGLESDAASQRSGIIVNAANNRGSAQLSTAQQRANLQFEAGMAEANINLQATLAKGNLMQQGTQFTEQFRADFSFASVNQAQAFLSNQAGVREEYQSALDNLALAGATLAQKQSEQALNYSMSLGAHGGDPSGAIQIGATVLGAVGGFIASGGNPAGALAGAQLGGMLGGAATGRQISAGQASQIDFGALRRSPPARGTPPINPSGAGAGTIGNQKIPSGTFIPGGINF